jgi:hypothetical protein
VRVRSAGRLKHAWCSSDSSRPDITDIQAVLGHVHLSTTEAYLKPRDDEVIERVNRHLSSRAADIRAAGLAPALPSRYSVEDMTNLFGGTPWQ